MSSRLSVALECELPTPLADDEFEQLKVQLNDADEIYKLLEGLGVPGIEEALWCSGNITESF